MSVPGPAYGSPAPYGSQPPAGGGKRPITVEIAFWLYIATAALTLIGTIIGLANIDQARQAAIALSEQQGQQLDPSAIDGIVIAGVVLGVVIGVVFTVLWAITMLVSLVPMLMIESSLGIARRTGFDLKTAGDEGVEYYRVREIGWSGLTIALATSFLMVTCGVAKERNVQRDVSYFKTSSPGDSTRRIVSASSEPIRVLLFFPAANEVKEQVKGYFEALHAATGGVAGAAGCGTAAVGALPPPLPPRIVPVQPGDLLLLVGDHQRCLERRQPPGGDRIEDRLEVRAAAGDQDPQAHRPTRS